MSYITYFNLISRNTLCILSVFLSAVLFCPFVSASSETPDKLVRSADIYRANFESIKAARMYESAFRIDSDNFDLLKKLVISLNDSGQILREEKSNTALLYFNKASEYSEIARDRFSTEPHTHFMLALSHGNLSRYTNGRKKIELAKSTFDNCKKMIELEPGFAPSYVILGVYYRELSSLGWLEKKLADRFLGQFYGGSLEESLSMLQKAVELEPMAIYAHFELAQTYMLLGENNKASLHLNRVLVLPVTGTMDNYKKDKSRKILSGLGL